MKTRIEIYKQFQRIRQARVNQLLDRGERVDMHVMNNDYIICAAQAAMRNLIDAVAEGENEPQTTTTPAEPQNEPQTATECATECHRLECREGGALVEIATGETVGTWGADEDGFFAQLDGAHPYNYVHIVNDPTEGTDTAHEDENEPQTANEPAAPCYTLSH